MVDDEMPLCYEIHENIVDVESNDDESTNEPEEPDDMHEPAAQTHQKRNCGRTLYNPISASMDQMIPIPRT
jgi:hypothetical protein